MTPFTPGAEILGRYRLEHVLGSGGMGEVWSALHLITHKRVALKVLKGESHEDARAESVRRFFREARAISAVNHPNVVAVHDLFEHEGCPIMVMDLLEGEPLSSKLGRAGVIGIDELARLLLPVISAVGAAHARGVVHRDLKPENIFLALSPSGALEPKVLDFGIAKLSPAAIEAEQTEALTNTGTLLGTPYYMAPEQVFGEKALDARCDVWAMGVILYLCLSGRRPFDGDNVGQIFKSIVTRSPLPLRTVNRAVPADLSALVDRMLEKNVETRCPDLREVFEVLGRYADVSAIPFGPPSSAVSVGLTSLAPGTRSSLPVAEAPTEMVSGQPALSVLTSPPSGTLAETTLEPRPVPRRRGRTNMIVGLVGATLAAITTVVVIHRSREATEPPAAGMSLESRSEAAASSEPSPPVAPAVVVGDVAEVPSALPPPKLSVESARPPSPAVSSRSARPRAPSSEAQRVQPAVAPAAPAKLPGGILDQEKAPF
ncbi:MAG TPA: protein kinase [Polyangiaceae bacterium]|nr:protein kinase [Polyangiaceae bacterium]